VERRRLRTALSYALIDVLLVNFLKINKNKNFLRGTKNLKTDWKIISASVCRGRKI
jgi:hypothetical protein